MTIEAAGIHLHRADAGVRSRWANGLGWTRELLRHPNGEAWDWRLSIAEVDAEAAFSRLPGIDRVLVLLTGAGLVLQTPAGEVVLDHPYAHCGFAGEDVVVGRPLSGPTTDFNLMWRRGRMQAALWVRPLVGDGVLAIDADATWLIHVAAGALAMSAPATLEAGAGETLHIAPASVRRLLRYRGAGTALFIALRESQQHR